MIIKAFRALRPVQERAERVASVPYDTVNSDEAAALAEGNPDSFLHVVRPEIDLEKGVDLYSEEVYVTAAANLQSMKDRGVMISDDSEQIYVYRQVMGDHSQTGIVACSNVEDYRNGLVKKHEKTRQDKEDDRTKHVRVLNANAGPVFLTYRDNPGIDAIVADVEKQEPIYDLTASDGIRHTVWIAEAAGGLVEAFKGVDAFYIADGHHRAAAAARAGMELAEENPDHNGSEEYNWFLTVLFPAGQLKILPYNRLVHTLNGKSADEFLAEVRERFTVVENADKVPDSTCSVRMYLGGRWYGISWKLRGDEDPVSVLDVSRLQDDLLAPVLGIDDPRTAKDIEFIGGIRGTDELERLVDSGKGAVAFSMYPCQVDQMMDIADADQIMPPKSTWFEPKLRSGLLVHELS